MSLLSHLFCLLAFSFLPEETPSGSFCNYPTYSFEQLNLRQTFRVEKARSIPYFPVNYLDRDGKYYLKTWAPNYSYANAFLAALERGLYDGITPLEGIFFDQKGVCRGYFTRVCKKLPCEFPLHIVTKNGRKSIGPLEKQSDSFRMFFEKLLENIDSSGMVYFDLHPSNVVYDQKTSQFYLIDLDSVCLREKLPKRGNKKIPVVYTQPEYRAFLGL